MSTPVKPDITPYLEAIESAVLGEEVRGSIHDAIKAVNDYADEFYTDAQEQAAAAAQSASNASGSATTASNKATAAAGSATAAAASAAAAEAAVNNAPARFLENIGFVRNNYIKAPYDITEVTDKGVTFTARPNGIIRISGTNSGGAAKVTLKSSVPVRRNYYFYLGLLEVERSGAISVNDIEISMSAGVGTYAADLDQSGIKCSGNADEYTLKLTAQVNTGSGYIDVYPMALDYYNITDIIEQIYTSLSRKQPLLTFDDAPTAESSNPVKSSGIKTALDAKQGTLTFDDAPTAESNNPVKSGGIKTALDAKQGTLTFDETPTANSNNPVKSKGIKTALDGKQNALGLYIEDGYICQSISS